MWLLILFLAIPLIEIALFIKVGGWLTLWPTLGIVVATALLGSFLVRQQGLAVLNDLRRSMSELRDPTAPLAHGALILLAGALLLTPGFFTDAVGLLLMVPAVRRQVIAFAARHVTVERFEMGQRPGGPNVRDEGPTIEGEWEEVDPPKRPTHGPSGWTRH